MVRTLVAVTEPKHQIGALHTASTVTVYQAYRPEIGFPAARDGRFPAARSRDRMTWVTKPRSQTMAVLLERSGCRLIYSTPMPQSGTSSSKPPV